MVMHEDHESFCQYFLLSIHTFEYVCGLMRGELEPNPLPRLICINGRLLDVLKEVAIALQKFEK